MKKYYVYKLIFTSGKIYIGATSDRRGRFYGHLCSSKWDEGDTIVSMNTIYSSVSKGNCADYEQIAHSLYYKYAKVYGGRTTLYYGSDKINRWNNISRNTLKINNNIEVTNKESLQLVRNKYHTFINLRYSYFSSANRSLILYTIDKALESKSSKVEVNRSDFNLTTSQFNASLKVLIDRKLVLAKECEDIDKIILTLAIEDQANFDTLLVKTSSNIVF